MSFPKSITILSDSNELKLDSIDKKSDVANYSYVKSKTKLGFSLPIKLQDIQRMLKDKLIK